MLTCGSNFACSVCGTEHRFPVLRSKHGRHLIDRRQLISYTLETPVARRKSRWFRSVTYTVTKAESAALWLCRRTPHSSAKGNDDSSNGGHVDSSSSSDANRCYSRSSSSSDENCRYNGSCNDIDNHREFIVPHDASTSAESGGRRGQGGKCGRNRVVPRNPAGGPRNDVRESL